MTAKKKTKTNNNKQETETIAQCYYLSHDTG